MDVEIDVIEKVKQLDIYYFLKMLYKTEDKQYLVEKKVINGNNIL